MRLQIGFRVQANQHCFSTLPKEQLVWNCYKATCDPIIIHPSYHKPRHNQIQILSIDIRKKGNFSSCQIAISTMTFTSKANQQNAKQKSASTLKQLERISGVPFKVRLESVFFLCWDTFLIWIYEIKTAVFKSSKNGNQFAGIATTVACTVELIVCSLIID